MKLSKLGILLVACWCGGVWSAASAAADVSTPAVAAKPFLLIETSRYNRGGFPGRIRDSRGQIEHFALKYPTALYDGAGRIIGTVTKPVMLNSGAAKRLKPENGAERELCVWAWATEAGSGWVRADALVHPPETAPQAGRNPKPPKDSAKVLMLDTARARELLTDLVHKNSRGELPRTGGNKGEHYAGRNPGPRDFAYLLFAAPNVQGGGVARDSIPNGGGFIQGLDETGKAIVEVITMYQSSNTNQPVPVTFIYGRAADGEAYGWLARANVGAR